MSQIYKPLESTGPIPPVIATSYVTNSGTAVPSGNVLNVLGADGITTVGSGNTIYVESADGGDLHVARYIVSPGGIANGANYTTIASAYAAAVAAGAPQTVFLQPGTYTENITLTPGINITAFAGDSDTPNVTIIGKNSYSGSGEVSISNINLQTNGDYFLEVTGSNVSNVNLDNCYLNCVNNSGIHFTNSNSASSINALKGNGGISTTGITPIVSTSAGNINIVYISFSNAGLSTTPSTTSSGSINYKFCTIDYPLSCTSTGKFIIENCIGSTFSTNTTFLTTAGTGTSLITNSEIGAGSAVAITIGAGSTLQAFSSSINSSNTNVITGAGTLLYGGIAFPGSSTITTTTQTPKPLTVQQGGTLASSFTAYAPIIAGTSSTGAFQSASTGLSTSGYVLTSNGASSAPSFQAVGSGTVTTVSVATANGFAGTVANPTTTPAITLTTSQTGLLSGNGTAVTGTAITQYNVITGGASNAPNSVAPSSTSGLPLISQGTSAQPIFSGTGVAAALNVFDEINIQTFTYTGSTQTYTPTSGMKYCIIECVGGGGGGGGSATSSASYSSCGGGGGGGGYSRLFSTSATIGSSQTVTIGAAGTGGTAGNNAGGNGGDTSVGSLCIGKGGTGGGGNNGGQAVAGGAGGVAGTGTFSTPGQQGGLAQYITNAASSSYCSSGGASGQGYGFGGAQKASASTNTTGNAGAVYGGGGGGGLSYNNGGTQAGAGGAAGIVIITEYLSV